MIGDTTRYGGGGANCLPPLVKNQYGVYSEIAGYPLAEATTVSEIEAYPWPKQEWFDTSTIRAQLANADRDEPRWINYHRAGKLFEAAWTLRGMEQMLIDIMTVTHAFQPDTPCENVVAMYEAAEMVYDE